MLPVSVDSMHMHSQVPIKDPSGKRSILVGIGFRERQPAFDFLSVGTHGCLGNCEQ